MAIPFQRFARALRFTKRVVGPELRPGFARYAAAAKAPGLGRRILQNRFVQTVGAAAGTAGLMDAVTSGAVLGTTETLSRRRDAGLQRQINQLRGRRRF